MPEKEEVWLPYTEPTDEDIKEFGEEARKAAWANLCNFYS